MSKEVNLDAFADRIAEKLLAAKQQANDAGQNVGEEFIEGVVKGIKEHSKDVKSEMARLFEDFNKTTNNFKSRKSISNSEWTRVLSMSRELLKSERYADSVHAKLNGIAVTLSGMGKISGLTNVLKELEKAENKLESVQWSEAGKNYKKKSTINKTRSKKTTTATDPKPAIDAEKKKQKEVVETTGAIKEQAEAQQKLNAVQKEADNLAKKKKSEKNNIDGVTASISKQGDAIDKVVKKTLNMASVIKRYNNLMNGLALEHLTIGTRFSEDTDGWGIEEMVDEAKYQLSRYFESGNTNADMRYGSAEEKKAWRSETGQLKRFIAAYEPYVDMVEDTAPAVKSATEAIEKKTDALREQEKAAEAQNKLGVVQDGANKTAGILSAVKSYQELKSVLEECEQLASQMTKHEKPEIIDVVESGMFKPLNSNYLTNEEQYVSFITEAWNEYKKLEGTVDSTDATLIKAEKTVTALAVSYARAHKELSAFNNKELEAFTNNKYREYENAKSQDQHEWGLHGTKTKANQELFNAMKVMRDKLLFNDKGSKIFSGDTHNQLLDAINQIILHGGKANDVLGTMAKLMGLTVDEASQDTGVDLQDNVVQNNQRKIESYQDLLNILREYFDLSKQLARSELDSSFVNEFNTVMPTYSLDDMDNPSKRMGEIMADFKNTYKQLSAMKRAYKDGIDFIDTDNMRIGHDQLADEIDYTTTKLAAMAKVYMELGGTIDDFNKSQQKVVLPKISRYDADSLAIEEDIVRRDKINAPFEAAQNKIRELLESMLPVTDHSEKLKQLMTGRGPYGTFSDVFSRLSANAGLYMMEPEQAAKKLAQIFGFEIPQAAEKSEKELQDTFDIIQKGENVTGKFVTTAKTVREALENMRNALPEEQKEWSTYIDSLLKQYDDNSFMGGNKAISGSMGNHSELYRIENLGDGRLAVTFSGIRDEAYATGMAIQKLEDHVNNLGDEFKQSEHYRDNFSMLVDGIKSGSITAAQAMEQMSDAYEEWSTSLVGGEQNEVKDFLDIAVDKNNPLVAHAFDGLNIKDWVKGNVPSESREQIENELYKLAQAIFDHDYSAYNDQLSRIADFIVENYKQRQAKEEDAYDEVFKHLEVTYTDVDAAAMGEQAFERAKSVLGNRLKKRSSKNKHVSTIDDLIKNLAGREDHGLFPGIRDAESEYNKFAQVVDLFDQWKMRQDGRSTFDVTLTDTDAQGIIDHFNNDVLNTMVDNMNKQATILEQKTQAAEQAKSNLEKVIQGVQKVSTHAVLRGQTKEDFESFAKQVADDSGMELGQVAVFRDDASQMRLATMKLINKELAQSITYTYELQENSDGINEAVLKSSVAVGDASKALEKMEAKERKAAKDKLKDNTWLLGQRSKLDTQHRRYTSPDRGVDGQLGIMSTETSLPDGVEQTIASLESHIRANIKKAFDGQLTDELRQQIISDLGILENEIKVRQQELYSSTTMKSSQVKTNKNAYTEYLRAFKARAQKNGVFDKMSDDIKKLEDQLNNVKDSKGLSEFVDNFKVARNKLQAETAELSRDTKTIRKELSILSGEEGSHNKLMANIRLLGEENIGDSLKQKIDVYENAFKALNDAMDNLEANPTDADGSLHRAFYDAALGAQKARAEIDGVFKQSQKLSQIGQLKISGVEDVSQLKDLKTAMIEFSNSAFDGKAAISGFNDDGTEMYVTLNAGADAVENITIALDGATGRLKAFSTGTTKVVNEWDKFKAQLSDGVKRVVGMYFGFQEGVQAVRKGLEYVKEIDLAMTELKKVTNETDVAYKEFLKDAGSTSAVIGSTISDFTEAAATFARLGYDLDESASMAQASIIYKNVADGIDSVEESSDSIISTMKAFGIEADNVMTIVDKFNAVGNNFAITSAGIGEALQRSASALYAAGNTIDESIALVTAANSVIQNPEQVGELIAHQHSNMLLANSYIG